MQWDFWTLCPQTAHQVIWLMGDRGFPKTAAHERVSSHTYMWVTRRTTVLVKYHFITDQGIEFWPRPKATGWPGPSLTITPRICTGD